MACFHGQEDKAGAPWLEGIGTADVDARCSSAGLVWGRVRLNQEQEKRERQCHCHARPDTDGDTSSIARFWGL